MWSKGAVVIIKRGDKEMADSMEASLVPVKEEKPRDILPRHGPEYWNREFAIADFLYGKNYHEPPSWARPIVGLYALIVYGISVVCDKIFKKIFH